jgi:soluble lytic murein transglycosylase-like protein
LPKRARSHSLRTVRRAHHRARSGPAVGTVEALLRLGAAGLVFALIILLVPAARTTFDSLQQSVVRAATAGQYTTKRHGIVLRYALRYGISFDLASEIEQAAIEEGVDPELAFRVVRVESSFREHAVSPAGALGLTQLMPATANDLQPGITREEIFHRQTNLRLGFRYLHWLLERYDGDVDEALHAYNRGPGTVARIRAAGGDPANGYADRVRGRRRSLAPYEGSGFAPIDAEMLRRGR